MSTAIVTSTAFGTSTTTTGEAQVVKTRLRITRRGRAVLVTLVAAPLVAAALALALNGGSAVATKTGSSVPLESVTVFPGESLWALAEEIAPQADPREFIADVLAFNQLGSADVQAGQQLDIPAEYSH